MTARRPHVNHRITFSPARAGYLRRKRTGPSASLVSMHSAIRCHRDISSGPVTVTSSFRDASTSVKATVNLSNATNSASFVSLSLPPVPCLQSVNCSINSV